MIDTLKWANRLKEAGIPEQQAYAYVEATVDALRQAGYGLTTDPGIADIAAVRGRRSWMTGD